MSEPANFLPNPNGELHDFEVLYEKEFAGLQLVHVVRSKSVRNALGSFTRAVPRHGRILKVSKL